MMRNQKLLLMLMNRILVLIVFTCLLIKQLRSQEMTERQFYNKVYCNVVLNDVVNSIVNFEELNNYQLRNWNDLIEIDTIYRLNKLNYYKGIAKFHFTASNYFLIYYVDCKIWEASLLAYGYEGENCLNKKGWNKIIKKINYPINKDSLNNNIMEYLFLDVNIPSNYCIYKIEKNSSIKKIDRFFSFDKCNSTIKFQVGNNLTYLIQNSNYPEKQFYVEVNSSKTKMNFYGIKGRRIKRKIQNYLGFTNNYLGPKILFKPRK